MRIYGVKTENYFAAVICETPALQKQPFPVYSRLGRVGGKPVIRDVSAKFFSDGPEFIDRCQTQALPIL